MDRRKINSTITEMSTNSIGYHRRFLRIRRTASAMRRLQLDVPGYAFPMQLWPQAAGAQLRMKEFPVRLIYNDPNRYFGGD